MEELKFVIAQNIIRFRVANGLTQIDLAEKLNYSDKSISKWERGLSLPDIYVLKQMSEIFGTTVDELLTQHDESFDEIKHTSNKLRKRRRLIITLIACGLVWLIATFVYVVLNWLGVSGSWKTFIYAIPATFVVSTIFSAIWGNRHLTAITVSVLVWTILLSVYIALLGTKAWLLFFIGIPAEVIIVLAFSPSLISTKKKTKKETKSD